jgi:outer membrane putative beta-barrel porin/alpha-amylase
MVRRLFCLTLCLLLAWCWAPPAPAQSLSPRAYVITPVTGNALIAQYSYQDGSLQFPGGVPITGATADINVGSLSYYHSFGLLGRSANVDVVVPYASGDFKGTVFDAPRSQDRTGFLDAALRFSVNLIGGPALTPAEFRNWHQSVLLGASLTIVAPTGEYDTTKLINYGSNRWSFKPELGYSQRFGHWLLDVYGGAWLFTSNSEFFSHNQYFPGSNYQSENTVGEVEGHISYDFRERLWVSLDANYWRGGATSLNGVENPASNQKSSRVGVTASIPLSTHLSFKCSYSDGDYVRYGGNYRTVAVALQYGWLGWKFR